MKTEIKHHNKLIRDLIPEILSKNGIQGITRILDEASYRNALIDKLQEEVLEFKNAQSKEEKCEELADVLEVIYALTATLNLTNEELEIIRKKKLQTRGSFSKKILLEKTIEN